MTYFQVYRSLSVNRQTCENFAQLAKRGYYNGVIFHRIIAVRHDEYSLLNFFSDFTYSLFFKGFYGSGWRSDWDR
jgi:hypothetical protein